MKTANDFLGSIAARALGTIPVVTPRPISRFEPESARAASFSAQSAENETTAQTSRPSEGLTVDSARPVSPRRPPSDIAAPPTPANSPPRAAEHEGRATNGVRASGAPVDTTAGRASASTEGAVTSRDGTPKRGSLEADVRTQEVRRRSSSPQKGNAWPVPVESAPSIHISIGRVDVRAIQRAEKPTPSRSVPESSRTSLGAYLRKRRD